MATQGNYTTETFIAGQDLSTKQYHFVTRAADGEIDATVAGAFADGVLQNKPKAQGHAATVGVIGRMKVVAGGTVAAGAFVAADANGRAVTQASTAKFLGKATEAAVAGQIFTIDFQKQY